MCSSVENVDCTSGEDLQASEEFCNQYRNKVIVAPMVRVCTLPFRLLALEYGADLVYSEETIDWKILRSNKRYNAAQGTTEFYDRSDGTVFLSTCEREREHLVVQLGTSDPDRALRVARMLEPYVAGIDVNMGCPKEFSIKGGMGAALLTQPNKIMAILKTLVNGLNIPVTCKIRILPELEDTLALCRLIERCGVAAVAVHGRTKAERPQHANHNDVIAAISNTVQIPVIANGGSKEINSYEDIEKFRKQTNGSSVMIARAVMWNCSILRSAGQLPLDQVIRSYLRNCIHFDNPFTYSKYTVQNMLRDLQESPRGKAFLETQTLQEVLRIWDLGDEYEAALKARQESNLGASDRTDMFDLRKWGYQSRDEIEIRRKTTDSGKLASVQMPMQFIRGNFCNADLPKMIVNRHVSQHNMSDPVYSSINQDRFFMGKMELEGVVYETTCIEKSRRYAEQAAAMVYLHAHELVNATYGFVAASGSRKYQHLKNDVCKTPRPLRQEQQSSLAHLGRNRRKMKYSAKGTDQVNDPRKSDGSSVSEDKSMFPDNRENLRPNFAVLQSEEKLRHNAVSFDESERGGKRESSLDRDASTVKVFLRSPSSNSSSEHAESQTFLQEKQNVQILKISSGST
ncbi:tRNA-dihydrouridine synthase [Trinorchestia longiramus]|nr:tRNA-dihydrouridine synthase [Trinorchestia longiramus]